MSQIGRFFDKNSKLFTATSASPQEEEKNNQGYQPVQMTQFVLLDGRTIVLVTLSL